MEGEEREKRGKREEGGECVRKEGGGEMGIRREGGRSKVEG